MKLKCKITDLNKISDPSILEYLKKYLHYPDGKFDMNMKREYTVYGILYRENSPWFYVCHGEDHEYPVPKPFEIFEIIDDRMSKYWKLNYHREEEQVLSELVFEEWAKDRLFYENLLDGEEKEEAIFKKYRKLMDEEFSNSRPSSPENFGHSL